MSDNRTEHSVNPVSKEGKNDEGKELKLKSKKENVGKKATKNRTFVWNKCSNSEELVRIKYCQEEEKVAKKEAEWW